MSRDSGPIRSVAGRNTANSNALISQSGTREGNNTADAFIIKAAANSSAAHTLTLTNASMGQATVLTIQDPGTGTANLVTSSGTYSPALSQVSVTLSATQMAAAFATPAVLVAAPGAGKMLVVHSATVTTASTGNTALATGTAPIIQYGTTVHGGGTIATAAGLVAGDITAATSQVRTLLQAASAVYTGTSNTAICFSNATGAYTAGAGTTVTFTLVVETISATV